MAATEPPENHDEEDGLIVPVEPKMIPPSSADPHAVGIQGLRPASQSPFDESQVANDDLTSESSPTRGTAFWHTQRRLWQEGKLRAGSGIKAQPGRRASSEPLSESEKSNLIRILEDTSGYYPALKRPLPLPLVVSCASRCWNDGDSWSSSSVSNWFSSSVVDPLVGAFQSVSLGFSSAPTTPLSQLAASSSPSKREDARRRSSRKSVDDDPAAAAVRNALRMRGGMVREACVAKGASERAPDDRFQMAQQPTDEANGAASKPADEAVAASALDAGSSQSISASV